MDKFGYLKNYFAIRDSTEWWFNQDTSRISNGAYGYKSFARWETFLSSRVDENGSLKTYSKAYSNAIDQIRTRNIPVIGGNWESIGPNTNTTSTAYLGIVTSMKVLDNNADTIYAGGGTGGLFVTYNGGNNWHCLTESYGVTGVEAIEINPQHHNEIYIGTGFFTWGREYSVGVMKSLDYGQTWNPTQLNANSFNGNNYIISDMCMDPDNPSTLLAIANLEYASKGKGTYLMKTTNGGAQWDSILPTAYYHDEFKKLEVDPAGFGTFYLSGTKVLKFTETQNGTYTWTDLTPNLQLGNAKLIRATTSVNPLNNNKIVVVLEKELNFTRTIEIWYSENYGSSFILLDSYPSTVLTVSYYKMEVEWSRACSNHFYMGGTYINLYEITADNTLIKHPILSTKYHKDIRHLELHTNPGIPPFSTPAYYVFTGNDGGVSKRVDTEIADFEDISKSGLNITQYYGFGIPADGSNTIIGGTQDGNFETYRNGNWTQHEAVGDAAEVVFDHTDPRTAYMVVFGLNDRYFYKTTDGGINWNRFINLDVPSRRNDAPLEMSNIDSKVLLVGGKNVWKTSDGGSTFTELPFEYSDRASRLKTIRFAPSNNDVIYAAYDMYYWNNNQIRLIKSSDGGLSWIDITPREQIIHLWSTGIFDLAVDPQNPDLFYITLDRNRDGHKVYKGEGSSTITWTNMSEGITNLPVNCIELLKGSTINEMFIGTDDGVYYRNNTLDHWEPFGTKLPIVSVSDLEIDNVNNELIASTFGRGIYKVDLCGFSPISGDIIINSSVKWHDKRVPENVVIRNEAQLTITGTVWMNEGTNIIVEKGGRLTIDGGTVRNVCSGKFWGGVIVNGTKDQPENPLHQGMVSIKNGTIMNAKIGIHSSNYPKYPPTGGGIIIATRASFINNIVGVQMEKYNSNNIANFILCNFITDNNFFEGAEFENFVRLNEVCNIKFIGCIFENSSTTVPIGTGIGIYSNWSHFVVDRYCKTYNQTTCIEYQKSVFKNLVYGIYNWGTPGGKTFSVRNTDFYYNDCGLYASATYNAIIKDDNIFTVSAKGEKKAGLYLDFCSAYVVENNTFEYPHGHTPQANTRGIVINNSGELDNIIYGNTFNILEFRICAQDINRNKDGSTGLRIKCNKFNITQFDIAITRSQRAPGYGIASAQGSNGNCVDPAGNLFSNPTNYTGYYGIVNDCEQIIYTHHDVNSEPKVEPSKYTQASVTLNPTGLRYSDECCPEHTSGGGGTIDQQLLDEKNMADSIQSELSVLIDDGNTDDKVLIVSTALEEENVEIQNDLLNTSPFVSDTVIQSVIFKENVFNNAMVRDIMVANPKSVKSETVIDNLNNRIEPMPEYMLDEILEGLDSLSMRELLEIKMQIGNSNYAYGFNRLLAVSMNDSLNSIENIYNLLDLDSTLTSKVKKAWLKLEVGDTLQAINYLDSIILTNQLSPAQSLEVNEQKAFMEWLSGVNCIDSTSSAVLNYFMASPSAYVSSSARGLLVANNLMQYSEPYLVPDFTKNTDVRKNNKEKLNQTNTYVKVYPNPAKDYVTIEYDLSKRKDKPFIYLLDLNGRIINCISIKKAQDQILVDTKGLKPGTYYVQLIESGKRRGSCRFTIVK